MLKNDTLLQKVKSMQSESIDFLLAFILIVFACFMQIRPTLTLLIHVMIYPAKFCETKSQLTRLQNASTYFGRALR